MSSQSVTRLTSQVALVATDSLLTSQLILGIASLLHPVRSQPLPYPTDKPVILAERLAHFPLVHRFRVDLFRHQRVPELGLTADHERNL